MSNNIQNNIIDFLKSDLKTLMIDGVWGIGKTFQIEEIIKIIDQDEKDFFKDKEVIYITPNDLINKDLKQVIHRKKQLKYNPEDYEVFNKFKKMAKNLLVKTSDKIGAEDDFVEFIGQTNLLEQKQNIENTIIIIDEFERKSKKIDTINLLNEIFLLKEDKSLKDIKIIISLNKNKLKKDENFNFNLILEMLNNFENQELSEIINLINKENIQNDLINKIELLKLEKSIINNKDEDFYLFNDWIDKIVDQYIKFENNSFLDDIKKELKENIKSNIKLPNIYINDLFKNYYDKNIRRFRHFTTYIKYLNKKIIENKKDFIINFENYKNLIDTIIEEYHKQINLNNIEEILTLNDEVFEKIIESFDIYMDKELNDFNIRNEIFQKGYFTNFMIWDQKETPFEYYKKIKLDFPKNNFIGKANSANSILKSCLNNIPHYFNYFNEKIDEKFLYEVIDGRLNLLLSHNDKYYEEIIYIKELLENYTELKEKAPVNIKTQTKESLPEELFYNNEIIIKKEDKLKILQKIKDKNNYSIKKVIKDIKDLEEKLNNKDKLIVDLSEKEDFYYIFDKIYKLNDSMKIVNILRDFIKVNTLTIEYLISYNENHNRYKVNVKEQIEKLFKFN